MTRTRFASAVPWIRIREIVQAAYTFNDSSGIIAVLDVLYGNLGESQREEVIDQLRELFSRPIGSPKHQKLNARYLTLLAERKDS